MYVTFRVYYVLSIYNYGKLCLLLLTPFIYDLGIDVTKPVIGASHKAKLKPFSSATETS